jgi:type IV pilus assembly protein PilM
MYISDILKKNSAVGLDIADRSIEIIELETGSVEGEYNVASAGRIALPEGIVERGRIKNGKRLSDALAALFAQSRPKPIENKTVVFGIPESQLYIQIFDLPVHNKEDRDTLVRKEAETSVPLEADDLLFSYTALAETRSGAEILLVATSKKVLQEWQQFFEGAGITVSHFDAETLAIARGLFMERPTAPTCVVDIGALSTTIAIFDKKGLRSSYSVPYAGESITNEIAKELGISLSEAEDQKVQIGLSRQGERIFFIIVKALQPIVGAIKQTIDYYKQKAGKEIEGVVLMGGTSKLKGLEGYLKEQITQQVRVGDPLFLKKKSLLEYIEAIGLALRGFDRPQDKYDPYLGLKKESSLGSLLERKKIPNAGLFLSAEAKKVGEEKSDEISFATPFELEQIKKLQFQKRVLLGVLLAGIMLILGADRYRDWRESKTIPSVSELLLRPELRAPLPPPDSALEENQAGKAATSSQAITEIKKEILVVIAETPTGWLNVREGPSTNDTILKKIYPGESYPLLAEEPEWYKIELGEGQEGWIASRYATKKSPSGE